MANIGFGLDVNKYAKQTGFDQFSTDLSDVLAETAKDAWKYNPVSSSLRLYELNQSRNVDEPLIPFQELNKKYKDSGIFFEQDEKQSTVDILVERKKEERNRQSIIQRGPTGAIPAVAKFGTAMVASVADPINLAMMFIPVVGQVRFASLVAKYGLTKARMMRGSIEGFTGIAAVEPLVYGAAKAEQSDYGLVDSFMAVSFGTILGGGLHVGAGKLKDLNTHRKFKKKIAEGKKILGDDTETDIDINLYREYYPENSQIMKDLEATDPNTRKMLLQKALGDTMLDNPVDVTPIANADPILRNSTDSSPNPDIRTTPKQSIDDIELKNLEDNIVNRNDIEQDAEIEILQSQLEAVKESQKDLNLQFEQGDSEIKLRTEDLDEVTTKKKEQDEEIKDAINCVKKRK